MELELKHLAPYLPYEMHIFWNKNSCPYWMDMGSYNIGQVIEMTNDDVESDIWKAILRPLLDLTKEIEVYGVKFMPMDILYPLFSEHLPTGLSEYGMQKKIELHPLSMPYFILEKLFEWHFDVFGLIPEGLAISIHDINQ